MDEEPYAIEIQKRRKNDQVMGFARSVFFTLLVYFSSETNRLPSDSHISEQKPLRITEEIYEPKQRFMRYKPISGHRKVTRHISTNSNVLVYDSLSSERYTNGSTLLYTPELTQKWIPIVSDSTSSDSLESKL